MAKIQSTSETLFPILDQSPVGLARLAAEATHADDGHLIEFKAMQSRSILNKSVSKRQLSLAWSINPYRGCEFGCKYCYARYTHEFLQPTPITTPPKGTYDAPQQPWALAFEREIYLKENAAWLLEQELRAIGSNLAKHHDEIAIGTATDPYQPIERRVGITRSILEVFAKQEGLRIGLITKSSLITRDIDLFKQIAARNTLVLHITITTADRELARKLEPRAPRPDLRFDAVRKLREAGLTAGVLCSPLLPGINDSLQSLDAVASRAAAAGASFLGAHPLFLKSCSRPTFLSFVREHFPALVADYQRRYATEDFASTDYRNKMSSRATLVCRTHGLGERSTDALLTRVTGRHIYAEPRKQPKPVTPQQPAQATLFAAS
ncbi:radical SAM protein [Granulicella sp. 5B5]|uniref:SPL family radical SAM protein n=1 Tax=Granulicella sp. 5B5 TaxID=1617967 RepID=UPI0015F36CB6|nr:radical SAM protein [Granulicella sp. 5B5]QMV18148.1 radical SAM protein [Granulicella sp. 5B5]